MARDVKINIGATNTASAALNKVLKQVQNLSSKVNRLGRSFQNAGRAVSSIGRRMSLMGGAAVAGIAVSAKAFANFDDAMARVSAKSQAFGADLDMLRQKAMELGGSTKFTAAEAASGMEFLAQAGLKTNEIMAAIGPALALAAAGGVELSEAADIATNIAGGFGIAAGDFERVANVMARAATSANTDVLMMGETFTNVAPVAKAAGQTLEETAAAMSLLANSGVQAGQAGTHLKIILQRLVENKEAVEALGVTVEDAATGEFRDLLDIMRDVGAATKDMTETERVQKFTQLFGRGVASAFIMADAGADSINAMRNAMTDATVTAASMAATMETGLGGTFTRIASAFESVQIALIDSFAGPLKQAGEQLADFLRSMSQWINDNKQVAVAIVAATGVITALGVALTALGATVTAAGIAISGFSTIASAVVAVVGAIATPVGAVTVAVGLLAAAFLQTEGGAAVFNNILHQSTVILSNLWETVKQTFEGITNALKSGDWKLATEIAWAGVTVAFWGGMEDIKNAVFETLPILWDAFKDFYLKIAKGAINSASTIAQALANPGSASLLGANLVAALFGGAEDQSTSEIDGFFARKEAAAQAHLDALTSQAAAQVQQQQEAVKLKGSSEALANSVAAGVGGAFAPVPQISPSAQVNKLPQLDTLATTGNKQVALLESISKGIEELIKPKDVVDESLMVELVK